MDYDTILKLFKIIQNKYDEYLLDAADYIDYWKLAVDGVIEDLELHFVDTSDLVILKNCFYE
jgi:hypothetical protein